VWQFLLGIVFLCEPGNLVYSQKAPAPATDAKKVVKTPTPTKITKKIEALEKRINLARQAENEQTAQQQVGITEKPG
jgi:hypothetical protein